MALDPSIILSGRPMNALAAMQEASKVATAIDAFQQNRRTRNAFAQYGAEAAAGQQDALNALARIDPQYSLDMQSSRQQMAATDLNMKATQHRMDVLSAEERRAAEKYASGLAADRRTAEAAEIEGAVKMGMAIKSPQEWDAVMQQQAPELVGQFGNRDALAARFMSMAEILKRSEGPKPLSAQGKLEADFRAGLVSEDAYRAANKTRGGFRVATPAEASQYGAAAGQIGPDGRFYPINPPSGMSIETGPDGNVRVVQGPGASSGKPFTEGQGKDVVYSTRARGALEGLEPVASALTSRVGQVAERVPLGFGREYLQGEEFQVAKNKGDEFLQAILRKDTGAAITEQEQALYGVTYLPQPGDSAALLEAKAEARRRALAAMEAGMSPDQILAQEKGLQATGQGGGTAIPRVGVVEGGYRFKGGNPADPGAWEKVQ